MSTLTSALWPTFTSPNCVSLKLAVTHTLCSGTMVISACPGCTTWPGSTDLRVTMPSDGATITA